MRALIALFASLALPGARIDRLERADRTRGGTVGPSYAYFEFAPSGGAGMGAACACSTPTGAKGETLTFTRASSGTCTKGNTTTGIANGDLVTCSTDQARVMPGGDGTGGNGLLVEAEKTNDFLRSEETENAAWSSDTFGGPSAITITADQAIAPDGTLTADRWQVPATGAGTYTLKYQTMISATRTVSIYLKGNNESGTLTLRTGGCTTCSYNPNTWTRCVRANIAASTTAYIGNDPLDCGGTEGAKDVFVWGAQNEAGKFASSYIKTAGAAVTRAPEAPTFALTTTGVNFSAAYTFQTNRLSVDNGVGFIFDTNVTHYFQGFIGTGDKMDTHFSTGALTATVATFTYGASTRAAHYFAAGVQGACVNGSCTTAATADPEAIGAGTLWIGRNFTSGSQIDGVIKKFCFDPDSTRCR